MSPHPEKIIIDFSKYSSIKIGGQKEVRILREKIDFKGRVLGGANNILLSPDARDLAMLGEDFDFIKILDENEHFALVKIGARSSAMAMHNFAKKHNLSGLEFLSQVPGTLGGLLKMNAGLCGEEISANLLSLALASEEIAREKIKFSYRFCELKGPFFSAIFKLKKGFDFEKERRIKEARSNQPSGPSFGSIFKNPPGNFAAKLIEEAGLKGEKKGGAMISDRHANFLINTGNATFQDALFLIKLAQKRVLENTGIHLEKEVVVW